MNLNTNKLDIEQDNLCVKFNCGEQKYMAYLPDGTIVTNLSDKSNKFLGKKNKELLTSPWLLGEEMKSSVDIDRRNKLVDLGYPCTSFEVLFSERETDSISDEVLQYLRELTAEDDVLLGIHRTGNCSLDDIASILRCGLEITRLNGNTTNSPIHLINNVSYYPNNETIIKELLNADTYKNSLGAILIRIPDEDLSKNIFMIDSESGTFILDPKYIVGFVPVGPNGEISEIIAPYTYGSPFKGLDALYEERKYAKDEDSVGTSKK